MAFKIGRKLKKFKTHLISFIFLRSKIIYCLLVFPKVLLKFTKSLLSKKSFIKYSLNLNKINEFEFRKTSQNNEDGIINYIFQKLKINNINFVEIGFDYYENNSLNFLNKVNGGIFIDGSEQKTFLMKVLLKIFYPLKKICVVNAIINKNNINDIIKKKFNNESEIDFLSIDVDGIDYYLFKFLKFNPKVICIEYNFWFGKEISCAIPYDENFLWDVGSSYSGCSLKALNDLANKKNYHLIALESNCINAFFIRNDLKEYFEILDPIKNFKLPKKISNKDFESEKSKLLEKKLNFFDR